MNDTANPDPVLDALLPAAIPVAGGRVVVRPLTLATFALLDKIRSPLLSGDRSGGVINLLPTLYVLTHGASVCLADLYAGRLEAVAIDWADQFPPRILAEIRDAADSQIGNILYLIPPPDDAPSKKKEMDGSSP